MVFLESQSLKNPRATTSLPLLEDEGEEKPFPSSPLSFVVSRAAERPTTSSTTMRCCLPLRRALRRCFFPVEDDDIIHKSIRFSFRDVVNDESDFDELAKLEEHRGEKEEENTADGIVVLRYESCARAKSVTCARACRATKVPFFSALSEEDKVNVKKELRAAYACLFRTRTSVCLL